MKKIDLTRPKIAAKPKICKERGFEKLDPVGYFLIRIRKNVIEVGLCDYNPKVIRKIWTGRMPQDIYRQIIEDVPKISRDHCAYLGKELARAWICMKTGIPYVQDGNVDRTFPEVDMIKRKGK